MKYCKKPEKCVTDIRSRPLAKICTFTNNEKSVVALLYELFCDERCLKLEVIKVYWTKSLLLRLTGEVLMDFTKAFYSGNALHLIFTLDFNVLILIRTNNTVYFAYDTTFRTNCIKHNSSKIFERTCVN